MSGESVKQLMLCLQENYLPPFPESHQEAYEKRKYYRECILRLKHLSVNHDSRELVKKMFLEYIYDMPNEYSVLCGLCEVLQSIEDPNCAELFKNASESTNMELKLCSVIGLCRIKRFDLIPDIEQFVHKTVDAMALYYYGMTLLYEGKNKGIEIWLKVLKYEKDLETLSVDQLLERKIKYSMNPAYSGRITTCLEYLVHGNIFSSRYQNILSSTASEGIIYDFWNRYYNANGTNMKMFEMHSVPEDYRCYTVQFRTG